MLYQPSDLPRPMRLQGVFVSDAEIGRVVDHWKAQIEDPALRHGDHRHRRRGRRAPPTTSPTRTPTDCCRMPSRSIREYDRASASLLQRRLKVGYARAARMIDQLEARGYIGAFDGSNARPVLRRDERRRRGRPDDGSTGTTDDDTAAAQARGRDRPVRRRPRASPPSPRRACLSACTPRASARASTSTAPNATPRSGLATWAPSSAATTRSCRARSTPRASCATTPLYLGLDPDDVLLQWRRRARRRQGDSRRPSSCRKPIAAPRKGLTFSPGLVVVGAARSSSSPRSGPISAIQVLRFAKPPTIAVTQPATAVIDVDESRRPTYTLQGTTLPGATVSIATPGRDPYQVTATLRWHVGGRRSTCAAGATSST